MKIRTLFILIAVLAMGILLSAAGAQACVQREYPSDVMPPSVAVSVSI